MERIDALNQRASLTINEYNRLQERESAQQRKVQLDSYLKSIDLIVHKFEKVRLSDSDHTQKENIMKGVQRHSIEPTNDHNLNLLSEDLKQLEALWNNVQNHQNSPKQSASGPSGDLESMILQKLKSGQPKFKIIRGLVKEHGFDLGAAGMFVSKIERSY